MLNDFTKILAEIIVNTLNYGREASFWLILGFLFAGFLKVFIPSDFLYKYLGKGSFRSIFMATLLGIPLPLCSCGVIPTGVGLYRQGVSKASTLAFFISTPATTVTTIMISVGMLGWKFTIAEIVTCFGVAFLTGILALFLLEKREVKKTGKVNFRIAEVSNMCALCENSKNPGNSSLKEKFREMFHYGFIEMVDDVGVYILIGLLTAGIVASLIPETIIENYLGKGLLPLFIMVLIGTPMYICSTASVPFVAAMAAKGMHLAAGLVFLVAGPATNLSTILVIGKVMGKRTAILYVSSIIFFTVFIAYGFCLVGWI